MTDFTDDDERMFETTDGDLVYCRGERGLVLSADDDETEGEWLAAQDAPLLRNWR